MFRQALGLFVSETNGAIVIDCHVVEATSGSKSSLELRTPSQAETWCFNIGLLAFRSRGKNQNLNPLPMSD